MTRRAFLSALAAGTGSLLCGPLQADVLQEGKADVTLGIGSVRVEVAPGHTVATTGFCGILDATSHTFRYCNASHPYPILVSSGALRTLDQSGAVLGVFPAWMYQDLCADLSSGERLLLRTNSAGQRAGGMR